jgi:hypothetical protein
MPGDATGDTVAFVLCIMTFWDKLQASEKTRMIHNAGSIVYFLAVCVRVPEVFLSPPSVTSACIVLRYPLSSKAPCLHEAHLGVRAREWDPVSINDKCRDEQAIPF